MPDNTLKTVCNIIKKWGKEGADEECAIDEDGYFCLRFCWHPQIRQESQAPYASTVESAHQL